MIVYGLNGEVLESQVHSFAKWGKRVMENLMLQLIFDKLWHDSCAKVKTLEKGFVCERCVEAIKRSMKPGKKLFFITR